MFGKAIATKQKSRKRPYAERHFLATTEASKKQVNLSAKNG